MAAKKLKKTDLPQKVHTEEELEQQKQQLERRQQHYQDNLDFDEFSAALGGEEGLQRSATSETNETSPKAEATVSPDQDAAAGSAASAEGGMSDDDKIACPSQQEAVDCMRRVLGLAEILGKS